MDSTTHILNVAERRIRREGYNAVSYSDIAAEIGIKSASLHYHFPKKEDLDIALVQRYTDSFRTHLNAAIAAETGPKQQIKSFVGLFRAAANDQ